MQAMKRDFLMNSNFFLWNI